MQNYSQNDIRWKDKPLNNSLNAIGEVGCLLTSLVNIYKIRHPEIDITPFSFNRGLIEHDGYTKDNYIIWAVVEKLLDVKIEHIYTGVIEYDVNSYYIVNFLNFGCGHFTNLVSKKDNDYNIFDVWDGKYKTITTPRRFVKVRFM